MIWLSLVAFVVAALAAGGVVRWMRGHAANYADGMPQRFHFGDIPRLGGAALLLGLASSWVLGMVQTAYQLHALNPRLQPVARSTGS